MWTKTFGGSEKDGGHSVYQTSDGGYIIAGCTELFSSGYFKLWLIKADSLGNVSGDKTFGDVGTFINPYPQFSVTQTTDNGYIICGHKASIAPEGYGWLIKTDVYGDTLWTREFPAYPGCRLHSVKETFDGGYVATGYISQGSMDELYLVKTNFSGDLVWTKTFGSGVGYSLEPTSDGGYITVGKFAGDIWLLKTDEYGDTVWTKKFGGNGAETGYGIIKTNDGGYAIVGSTRSFGISERIWLLKTDAFGDTVWTKTFGGYGDYYGYSLQQTCDGGYIVTGRYSYPTGGYALPIIKTDGGGNIVWYKNLESGIGRSVLQATDFGYIIAGSIYNDPPKDDLWLIKTKPITVIEPNGWEFYSIGDTVNIYWMSECITDVSIKLSINNGLNWNTIIDSTANTGIYSWVVYASDSSDQCLIKISNLSDSTIYDVSNNVFTIGLVSSIEDDISNNYPKEYTLDQNFPNPFNPSTIIKYQIPVRSFVTLIVFDVLGNEVATLVNEERAPGSYEVSFSAVEFVSGVYIYSLRAGNFIQTRKMILIK
jgi:hypothetical protein